MCVHRGATGWRAQSPGEQTVRLFFEAPQRLRRIRLLFREDKEARTQEFILRWSPTADGSSHDVVRQQYHFSPSGATEEREEYRVELEDVAALELTIIPNLRHSVMPEISNTGKPAHRLPVSIYNQPRFLK
jgi:hypothetical protein